MPKQLMHYAGSAWDELKHIRQAIGFLVFVFSAHCNVFFNSLLKYSHENVVDSWRWKSVGYLAYNNCTGLVRCTGMTSMVHTASHQM
ncbi:hypothetical protein IFM89_012720 [Coptis chinensis]|uniref:Uncharacterized protein n=1 Tax=Coptis chinensis TaxID=261450 RepID=A0A835HE45_9MAGN|nr:hypothetical protein IFM89_012720 [Coptis chinensis]